MITAAIYHLTLPLHITGFRVHRPVVVCGPAYCFYILGAILAYRRKLPHSHSRLYSIYHTIRQQLNTRKDEQIMNSFRSLFFCVLFCFRFVVISCTAVSVQLVRFICLNLNSYLGLRNSVQIRELIPNLEFRTWKLRNSIPLQIHIDYSPLDLGDVEWHCGNNDELTENSFSWPSRPQANFHYRVLLTVCV